MKKPLSEDEKMMKVLGVDCSRFALPEPTGVERYTDRVVEGLVKQADSLGYGEVRLYVKNADQVERLLALLDEAKQGTAKVKLIERNRLWTLLGLSWELFRRPVDTLFVPSHVLPFVTPKRSFLTVHGVEALLYPHAYSFSQRWQQRRALQRAKKKGAQLIAVSKTVKKNLLELMGISEDLVKVVWNGYDHADDEQRKDPKALITGDYILHVGRLEARKNQQRLVQAFAQIAADFPDLKLVLVGPDGGGERAVKEEIEKSEVAGRILLAGYQDQEMVYGLMSNAQLFAYPSLAEGFGIPILEAFDAACPVLTSRGSATEEIGGAAAVYCDAESVESIAEGLRKLLSDKKLREQKLQDAQKRLDLFGWDKCVEGVVKLLKMT